MCDVRYLPFEIIDKWKYANNVRDHQGLIVPRKKDYFGINYCYYLKKRIEYTISTLFDGSG